VRRDRCSLAFVPVATCTLNCKRHGCRDDVLCDWTMLRRISTTLLFVTALLLPTALAAETTQLAAGEVLRRIASEGSQSVLESFWNNEERFEYVNFAVARALPANPTGVLRLIDHGFKVDDVCTSPFIEPEPGVAEGYARRAAAALRGSIPKDLDSVRAKCLSRIVEPRPTP
jgi:hypothetical protein